MDQQQPPPTQALSPPTSPSSPLNSSAFSLSELEAASKVLAAIQKGGKSETDPALRKLRGQVFEIVSDSAAHKTKVCQSLHRQARKAHDQALLDSTGMRSSRLRRMSAVRKQLPDSAKDVPLFPDGAAAATSNTDCRDPRAALESSSSVHEDDDGYRPKRRLHKPIPCYICKELFVFT